HPDHPSQLVIGKSEIRPRSSAFGGDLIFLIDRGCTCACEDFLMPFKATGRARLVGGTTARTFFFTERTEFDNGMMLNVASVRNRFPDGSRFEGVGITPDLALEPSVDDLKSSRDVVLARAIELALGR